MPIAAACIIRGHISVNIRKYCEIIIREEIQCGVYYISERDRKQL